LVTKLQKHRIKASFALNPNFWGNMLQLAQIDVLVPLTTYLILGLDLYTVYYYYTPSDN
jgi:hypothetical protein